MVAALAGFAAPASADPPRLTIDKELAALARQTALPASGIDAFMPSLRAACAATGDAGARFIVTSHAPGRAEQAACAATLTVIPVAREAVLLHAPIGTRLTSLTPAQIFLAVAASARGSTGPAPAQWSEIDAQLPAVPIAIMLPPAGSAAAQLFDRLILEPGCIAATNPRAVPFAAAARAALCSTPRIAPAIRRRDDTGGSDQIATWLAAAGPGAVAVIALPELRALGGQGHVIALGDVLPTAQNVALGTYTAARDIRLVIVLPRDTAAASRSGAMELSFALTAEQSIGPSGTFVAAGLSSLSAAARVAARDAAFSALER